MIISRALLKSVLPATSGEDNTRYYLSAVHVHPDGMVEATDATILVRARDPYPQLDDDYPTKDLPAVTSPEKPVLLPVPIISKLLAAMPKKSTFPILRAAQIGVTAEGKIQARATDLDVPMIADITEAQSHQWPMTDRVMIKDGDRPVVKLILSAAMLTRLAKIATEAGTRNGDNAVTLEIPEESTAAYRQVIKGIVQPEIISAVRFTTGSTIKVEGVVMPCHR